MVDGGSLSGTGSDWCLREGVYFALFLLSLTTEKKVLIFNVQGVASAGGLGYVDISSVSYGCYPETELMIT